MAHGSNITVALGPSGAGDHKHLNLDSDGNLKVNASGTGTGAPITQGTPTDRSGTITVGGTSQSMMSANTSRKFLFIQNLHPTEDLWIRFGSAAAVDGVGSIVLGPTQTYENPSHYIMTSAIHVIAATTGHKFTAYEGT